MDDKEVLEIIGEKEGPLGLLITDKKRLEKKKQYEEEQSEERSEDKN